LASLALAFCGSTMLAQSRYTKKADKRFNDYQNVKAIKEYKEVLEDGHGSPYVYKRLGDTYYRLGDTKNAALYYGKYLESADASKVKVDYYYRYAQMLKSNGQDNRSNQAMQKFVQHAPNDVRAQEFRANPNYLADLKSRDKQYKLFKLEINSEFQDFGPYFHNDKLYFVSARNESRRKYRWNGQPTLDVYVSSKKAGKFLEPELIEGDINTNRHEGRVAISNDGKTMYFTRTDGKKENGKMQLQIYSAKILDESWADVK